MTKVRDTESLGSKGSSTSSAAQDQTAGKDSDNDKPPPEIPMVQSSSKSSVVKKGGSAVRCHTCKKKIGIACRYQCRCGLTFCATHRYPETHSCTFDYKTEGRNQIREANPVIVAPKIQNI